MFTFFFGWALLSGVGPIIGTESTPYEQWSQTESGEAREQKDKIAQISMAWAAWAQVLVGGVGLAGLAATVYFSGLAWKESQQANIDAREFFDSERRPWVRVDADIHAIHGQRGASGRLGFVVETENIGLSHALDVVVFTPEPSFFWSEEEIAAFADELARAREESKHSGTTLFPREREQHFQNLPIELPPELWEDTPYLVFVSGWVVYRLTPSGPSHFTPFCFSALYWWSEEDGGGWGWVEPSRVAVPIAPD